MGELCVFCSGLSAFILYSSADAVSAHQLSKYVLKQWIVFIDI